MIGSKQQATTPVGKSPAPLSANDAGAISSRSRSQLYEFWLRFRRHQMAVIGTYLFGFLILLAVVGPFIVPAPNVDTANMFELKNNAPSWSHIFGTTDSGIDIFSLVIHGAPVSLFLSTLAMLVACIFGTIFGLVSGYFGKLTDSIMMRIADVFLSIPLLFVLLLASRFLVVPPPPGGSGGQLPADTQLRSLLLLPTIIGMLTWPGVARLVRSVTLSVKEQEFVIGARAIGAKNLRIMFVHILPNVINPVVVSGTLLVGGNIVLESFLSFLGYGIKEPLSSWGTALSKAQTQFASGNWWWAFFPGLFILLTVLSVNFIGDGLRDALDPRSKR